MSSTVTSEQRVAKAFGLSGDSWMRHANPISVWTRFTALPLIMLSVWSRDWIGWWSLLPIALSVTFLMVNPLLFKEPASTRNWASRGVFGERIWADRKKVELPAKFAGSSVYAITYSFQTVGLIAIVFGLWRLDLLATIAGLVIIQLAKSWYIDRMVLLFDDMKERDPEYAGWEY